MIASSWRVHRKFSPRRDRGIVKNSLENQTMKKRIVGGVFAASLMSVSGGAFAETFTNENGERMECHQETVRTKGDHPIAGPVLGAVVGGVIGNQIGGGSGKDIATGVGAAGGAIAGHKINENRVESGTTTQQVCRRVG